MKKIVKVTNENYPELYDKNLEKYVLMNTEGNRLVAIKSYEVVFHRYNFLYLTCIKANNTRVGYVIHFYGNM